MKSLNHLLWSLLLLLSTACTGGEKDANEASGITAPSTAGSTGMAGATVTHTLAADTVSSDSTVQK